MNTGNNRAEFGTTQKTEGKYLWMKIIFIAVYIAFFAAFFLIPGGAFVAGCISVVCTAILIFFTWRYTTPDYKYIIETGDMSFFKNYGKKDIFLFKTKVKEMEYIAPYTDEYNAPAKASDVTATYDYRGTAKTPDAYFAVFTENGKKKVVLFEATEKAVKLFAYYNKQNTVVKEGLRH